MYIFLGLYNHEVWQCKLMNIILNHVLYFVLFPLIYVTVIFVHILIIVLLHKYKEGPLQISTPRTIPANTKHLYRV